MCVCVCDIISNGLKLDGSNEMVSDGVGGTGVHGWAISFFPANGDTRAGKVVSSLDLIEVLLSLLMFTNGGKKENMRSYGDIYESIWNTEVGGGN